MLGSHRGKEILCVITGMHRSGTTWMGRALECLDFVSALHEPFNFRHGLAGVSRWYPRLDDVQDVLHFNRALDEIRFGNARFRRLGGHSTLHRLLGRLVVGSRQEREYKASLKQNTTKFLLKEPFLLRMAPLLVDRGIPVVVMIRHPAAILNSIKRMNWPVGVDVIDGLRIEGEYGEVKAMAQMWHELHKPLIECLKLRGAEGVFIVDHESVFDDLPKFCGALLDFLGVAELSQRQKVLSYVQETSSGDLIQPVDSAQHHLTRNSRALSVAWREYTDKGAMAVFEGIVGTDLAFFRNLAMNKDGERVSIKG
jgi:hypothetical protein